MKILSKKNVFDAALERINFLFDEFPNVVAGISGGKDSTVIFELALMVARERERLPLTVFFLDQEAEWTATIDQVRRIMHLPEVKPLWMQMPMHLDNAASFVTKFLKCWDPEHEADWVHEKDPVSLKENIYGTNRFKELFPAIFGHHFQGQRVATLTGVRTEESPARYVGLTQEATYKWVTWGKKSPVEGHFTFHPIYDWSYTDVWHAIHSNKWSYNAIYDYQYRYGVPVREMRVSNLHHETAVRSLFHLQEIDPALYERLAKRLPGVDTAGKMGTDNFYAGKLPFMFRNWPEYRNYLIDKLAANDPDWQARLREQSRKMDDLLTQHPDLAEKGARAVVQSILCNDYTGTKVENFRVSFTGLFKRDKRDILPWDENGTVQRSVDPVSFGWFERRIKLYGKDEDGQRRYYFMRHRYWIEGDTLHRQEVKAMDGTAVETTSV